MKKFLTTALAAAAIIFTGYVSSTTTTQAQAQARSASDSAAHLDAHVGYYEQHLSRLGLARKQ